MKILISFIALLTISICCSASSTSGSGKSLLSCNGFVIQPCAPAHTAVSISNGANSNGTSFVTGSAAVNAPWVDQFFGERGVRVTDVNSQGGDKFSTPGAGWQQNTNCSGTSQGASCPTAPFLFTANDNGGGGFVFKMDRTTLSLTRVDAATFTGTKTAWGGGPTNWASTDPNRQYINYQSTETTIAAMQTQFYEWNPASPGPQSKQNFLAFNAGPLGSSFDNTAMPNSSGCPGGSPCPSVLNGLLTIVGMVQAIAPVVCDGSSCVENGATPSGATCNTVTGFIAGASCITVSTTGGSLSGRYGFAADQDMADTQGVLHEQNLYHDTNKWTGYNFTGGTGSVTAVAAPTQLLSPGTAQNWHVYIGSPSLWGNNATASSSIQLSPQQFQVAYSVAITCSGSGGGACPALPITSVVTAISSTHHSNFSCETYNGSSSSGCEINQNVINRTDTQMCSSIGGMQQGNQLISFCWDTTKGARWLDLSKGTLNNGATDAAGVSCGSATDCWTAPTGQLTWVPDPQDTHLAGSSFQGLMMHELWNTLDGRWVACGIQIGQTPTTATENFLWWDTQSLNVYATSSSVTASNWGGHPGVGYTLGLSADGGNPVQDGSFDWRGHLISTSTSACSNQQYATGGTLPCIFNFNNTGFMNPYPVPNSGSTGYPFIGSGRQDQHFSAMDEVPGDTNPFLALPYAQFANYTLSPTAGSITRTGCPSACIDTFKVTASFLTYMPGDQVTVNGVDDSSFNITCIVSSVPWTITGSITFACPDPGKSNATTENGNASKTDTRPGRGFENEVLLISVDGSGKVYRAFHHHFDALANSTNLGPNGSISQDGHFALWTSTDSTGTRTDVVIGELR